MTPFEWIGVAAALSLGVFVQAATGFAAGMISIPILMSLGHSIPAAQAALLIATFPQNAVGIFRYRSEIDFRSMSLPAGVRILFFPIGIATLVWLQNNAADRLRLVVSLFILTATLVTIIFRPQPRESVSRSWSLLVFPLSGFFQGVVGMGGPVLVLWVQAHDWSTRRARGFLFTMFIVSMAPAFLVLTYQFGSQIFPAANAALLTIPVLLVVTRLGLWSGDRLGRHRLRLVSYALLLVIGLSGLI
ncbi:MAG: sulfite exporter TauE/SafE family protein [Planctomycetota bacterium]